ncbi:cytochrome P450 [Colletotrichum caudatum]|nr:cytochrome P450 [Colletotrichum caudatum]
MFDPSAFGPFPMVMNAYVPGTQAPPFQRTGDTTPAGTASARDCPKLSGNRSRRSTRARSTSARSPTCWLAHMILESRAIGDPWSRGQDPRELDERAGRGARDLSATTLTWATHTFTLHPHIRERARKEVLDLLARKPNPDYMGLDSLRRIDNIIKETLRFFAPGVLAAREPVDDIDVCGTVLPRGTAVLPLPGAGHAQQPHLERRRGRVQPGPLGPPTRTRSRRSRSGPASASARSFALLEIKVLLMEMLSDFMVKAAVDPRDMVLVNPSPVPRPQGASVEE